MSEKPEPTGVNKPESSSQANKEMEDAKKLLREKVNK